MAEAKEFQAQDIGMMRKWSIELRKWSTNCPQLLLGRPQEQGDETIRAL